MEERARQREIKEKRARKREIKEERARQRRIARKPSSMRTLCYPTAPPLPHGGVLSVESFMTLLSA